MAKTHEQRLLSRREMIAHKTNQQKNGFEFPLSATFLGIPEDEQPKARVRRISLSSQASIDQIPSHLQDAVNRGLEELAEVQKRVREDGTSTETLRDRISNNEAILPAANAYCLAVFIEPRLTEHEADATDEIWWVEDLAAEDRLDIFYANLNADSAAAKKFRIYRPKPVIDVPHRPAEPVREYEAAPDPESGSRTDS